MNAIGGVVVLFRHRSKGIRRMLEFGEILETGDINVLHRWNILTDTFMQISELTRLLETLQLYGGYTKKDMITELEEKRIVLEWMVKNKITGIDDAGYVISSYYKDRAKVFEPRQAGCTLHQGDAVGETMREYKDLLATVSGMDVSSPRPSVNYVQMEIGAGESLSIDSPRSYPKLLNEVAGFDTGFQLPKQKKATPIIPPQQSKPQRQAPAPNPPPQPKAVQPEKPVSTLEPSPAQPTKPNKPAFGFFNRGQKPVQPASGPKPQPAIETKPSPTLAPSAPEVQKPASQKVAPQPKPLEDSVAKELKELTKNMKAEGANCPPQSSRFMPGRQRTWSCQGFR